MARTASGREFLEQAEACLAKAKTVSELRQAQAVVLPLALETVWQKFRRILQA